MTSLTIRPDMTFELSDFRKKVWGDNIDAAGESIKSNQNVVRYIGEWQALPSDSEEICVSLQCLRKLEEQNEAEAEE